MVTRRYVAALALALALCWAQSGEASAQQVFIDQGVQAAGLWCFPVAASPRQYVYLPTSARLASDEAGRPQFSFVRYVTNAPGAGAASQAVTNAGGGGILHFLVLYETPPAVVEAAQQSLRRTLKDDAVVLRGPVIFKEGRFALVSSILNPSSGSASRRVLATGNAPVVEGNRLALSFDLQPHEASLLMQSFAVQTPDVSLVFDMTFQGLSDAYDAELSIDWAEVNRSEAFKAGGSLYFVSADVERTLHDLQRTNAIKLRSQGGDAAMEGLLSTVYNKLLELMFRPVEPERVPAEARGGLMDALSALVDTRTGPLASRNTTGFGLAAAYKLRELKTSGTSVLNFNHRAAVERHSFITFNIGDFHRRYGRDANYFRAVNTDDPTFQQREVHVVVDGALLPDFDRYINNVSVTLRKVHQNGAETLRELVLNREQAIRPDRKVLVYGWNEDDDRRAWREYTYRTNWSFKGGGSYRTDWATNDSPAINLFAPYERRTVQFVGDPSTLRDKGVRAVVMQLEHSFFGARRRQQLVLRPDQPAEEQRLEVILPQDQFSYDYTITWQFDAGRRVTARGRDTSGVVFIDEVPDAPKPPAPHGGPPADTPPQPPPPAATEHGDARRPIQPDPAHTEDLSR